MSGRHNATSRESTRAIMSLLFTEFFWCVTWSMCSIIMTRVLPVLFTPLSGAVMYWIIDFIFHILEPPLIASHVGGLINVLNGVSTVKMGILIAIVDWVSYAVGGSLVSFAFNHGALHAGVPVDGGGLYDTIAPRHPDCLLTALIVEATTTAGLMLFGYYMKGRMVKPVWVFVDTCVASWLLSFGSSMNPASQTAYAFVSGKMYMLRWVLVVKTVGPIIGGLLAREIHARGGARFQKESVVGRPETKEDMEGTMKRRQGRARRARRSSKARRRRAR